MGFEEKPADRTLYRDLERIGANSTFILENYQNILKKYSLVSNKQFLDLSSSYFEGNNSDLGALGYSRDNELGKKQLTFGISTSINNIPTALTVQKGNVQDKKHFRYVFRVVKRVLPIGTLLIFDCGANTKDNKENVLKDSFNYLTLNQRSVNCMLNMFACSKNNQKKRYW